MIPSQASYLSNNVVYSITVPHNKSGTLTHTDVQSTELYTERGITFGTFVKFFYYVFCWSDVCSKQECNVDGKKCDMWWWSLCKYAVVVGCFEFATDMKQKLMKDSATITPALANQYLHKIVDDDDDESNKISINCLFPSLSRMERITSFKK